LSHLKRKLTLNNILYSQGILSILFTHLREKILSAQYARQLVERLSVAVLMLALTEEHISGSETQKTKAITILLAISTMSASHLMSKTIWFTSLPTEPRLRML
ncbi:hypothetical protein AHY55_22320, partial [Salmonella enterica subsp. enterica]|nr:hypothetical protein [Salmonella enterica subsp. enterica serovar Wandsworth]